MKNVGSGWENLKIQLALKGLIQMRNNPKKSTIMNVPYLVIKYKSKNIEWYGYADI